MTSAIQFTFSGLTMGAIYALVAIGFVLIYNASSVVNFAQGEFVMLGGMLAVTFVGLGLPLPLACLASIALTTLVGLLLYLLAIRPAGDASVVSLIIITIGASIFIRGVAGVLLGKGIHQMPDFLTWQGLNIAGASLGSQSLLVLIGTSAIVLALWFFLARTLLGKAIVATASDRLGAQLAGISTSLVIALCFVVSAAIGAIGGLLITPIGLTSYDFGAALAVKGFTAAVLGGLGNPLGAIVGGLTLGLLEAWSAGYISSLYKDAIAFIVLLAVLVLMPNGLMGRSSVERV